MGTADNPAATIPDARRRIVRAGLGRATGGRWLRFGAALGGAGLGPYFIQAGSALPVVSTP